MSLTCHEKNRACLTRMLRGCERLVRNKSCVSGSWNLENDTTHGQTGSTIHRSRPPSDHCAWQLNGEVARHARHARHPRSILERMSGVSTRKCHDDATRNQLPWNLGCIVAKRLNGSSWFLLHESYHEEQLGNYFDPEQTDPITGRPQPCSSILHTHKQ